MISAITVLMTRWDANLDLDGYAFNPEFPAKPRGATAIFLRFPVGVTNSGMCELARSVPGRPRFASSAQQRRSG